MTIFKKLNEKPDLKNLMMMYVSLALLHKKDEAKRNR